ncbi:MAG: hypothetical protein AAGI24_12520 [Pseudomonadota bacterium]
MPNRRRKITDAVQHGQRSAAEFKGLQEWFDIFYVGTHTDSAGRTQSYDEAYLQQIAANSTPDSEHLFTVPLVVGHPKMDDPAFGWGVEFKLENVALCAKADRVHDEFASMVEDGRYPNRSVKIVETDYGPTLAHIGFFGAAAPALDGLDPVYRQTTATGAEFQFSTSDWYATSVVSSLFRRLRDWMIEEHGLDTADKVLNEWDVNTLEEEAVEQRVESCDDLYSFSVTPNGAPPEESEIDTNKDKQFTEADLDAAKSEGEAAGKASAEAELSGSRPQWRRAMHSSTQRSRRLSQKAGSCQSRSMTCVCSCKRYPAMRAKSTRWSSRSPMARKRKSRVCISSPRQFRWASRSTRCSSPMRPSPTTT